MHALVFTHAPWLSRAIWPQPRVTLAPCMRAGGRMAFVWDVLRRVCDGLDRPLILFVHDVEHMLCGSFERYDAFEEAFGLGKVRAPLVQLPRGPSINTFVLPLVVIGGCSLGESGTHLTSAGGCV